MKNTKEMTEQAEEATSLARDTFGRVAEQAKHGYEQIQSRVGDTVHDRPGMSLAAAFGLGVVAGVGLSVFLFNHEQESISRSYTRRAEDLGRKFWDTIAQSVPESFSRRG